MLIDKTTNIKLDGVEVSRILDAFGTVLYEHQSVKIINFTIDAEYWYNECWYKIDDEEQINIEPETVIQLSALETSKIIVYGDGKGFVYINDDATTSVSPRSETPFNVSDIGEGGKITIEQM